MSVNMLRVDLLLCDFSSFIYILSSLKKRKSFGNQVWLLQYSVKLAQTNPGFESFACS